MDDERKRSDPIYAAAYERQREEIKRQTEEKARYHAKRLTDLARQQNADKARQQARKSKFNDFKAGLEARKAANEAAHPGASDQTRRRSSASESASPPNPLHGWSTRKHRLEDEPGAVSYRAVKQEPGSAGRSDDHSLFVEDASPATTATNNASSRSYMTVNSSSGTGSRGKEDDYRLTGSRSFRPPQAANEPAARRRSSQDTEHRLTGNGIGSANSSRPNSLSDPIARNDQRNQRSSIGTLTSHGKRPSNSHSTEDIRASLSKAHKPSSAASSSIAGSGDPDLEITGTGPAKKEPKWYWDLKLQNKRRTGDPTRMNADGSLQRLKDFIGVVIKNHENGHVTTEAQFNDIRERLHTLAFLVVDPQLLRQRRMMHDDGLPRLFGTARQGITWPFDIKADAKELYIKWFTGEFEVDIYRGITRGLPGKTASASSSAADRLAPGHDKFKLMDPKQHGNGRLLNGQWWPSQLAALRDGAHGSSQGGITGSTGSGAFSVIMAGGVDPSGQPYPNEDRGDEVLYCGTDNKASTNEPSVETQFMLENVRSQQPVRLIRSHNLSSQYSPELGFRYDGLYTVVSYEEMDPSTVKRRRHRFRLVRCAGQDPIRGQGPGKRPTAQEKEAYEKDKKNRGR